MPKARRNLIASLTRVRAAQGVEYKVVKESGGPTAADLTLVGTSDLDFRALVRIQRGILSPFANNGRTLRVKLRYRTVVERDGARKELSAALPARIPCGSYVTLQSETATRAEGECYFLDVNVPMARVLPSGVGERERSEALAAYVSAVLGVAD